METIFSLGKSSLFLPVMFINLFVLLRIGWIIRRDSLDLNPKHGWIYFITIETLWITCMRVAFTQGCIGLGGGSMGGKEMHFCYPDNRFWLLLLVPCTFFIGTFLLYLIADTRS